MSEKMQKGFRIYNTLSRGFHEFPPPEKHPEITIYLCGLTTYDYAHLGNMRGPILFDVFRKFLREIGYRVQLVTNLTDVDDKVIKRAKETNDEWYRLTKFFSREYMKDLEALGVERPNFFPKVTHHIEDIIDYIKKIFEAGYAYESNGNVYFNVPKFNADRKSYGKLSGRNIDEMVTEARTEHDPNKRDQLDFALWKADPGFWKSPWGEGRPGWHIDCSTMSTKYLGAIFDIHSGAIDLKFPHHENEIAQAEVHSGPGSFAQAWMHYEFINWKGGKLAKSGESFAVRDLYTKYNPELIRQFVLSAKYRSPIEFSDERMEDVKRSRERIDNFFFDAKRVLGEWIEEERWNLKNVLMDLLKTQKKTVYYKKQLGLTIVEDLAINKALSFEDEFLDELRDDFNTQGALSKIFNLINIMNSLSESIDYNFTILPETKDIINLVYLEILWAGGIFGLFQKERDELFQAKSAQELLSGVKTKRMNEVEAMKLLEERQRLKSEKKFAEADAIREKILSLGFEVRDTPEGAVLKSIE